MKNFVCSGSNFWMWLLCPIILGLAACGEIQPQAAFKPKEILEYPPPPDPPRFAYDRVLISSTDVEEKDPDSAMKSLLTGESESGEGLDKPYGVAVHKGRVFISDTVAHAIKVFDVPTGRFFKIGEEDGPGQLAKPLGISVDASGTLYVADISQKIITVYNRDGKYLRNIGGPSFFSRLTSASVDPKGERVYAVDLGGTTSKPEEHRVRVFNAKTGAHLFDFGKRGTGPGEFNLPRDLAFGKNNDLYVVDAGNFRIQVFDYNGNYLRSFGKIGKKPGNLGRPKEIDTDADGNVYVVDSAFANLQIFNPDGQVLLFIGARADDPGPAHFLLPQGVAVDEDGRIYVVDQWYRKVDIFRPIKLGKQSGYLVKRASNGEANK